MQSYKERLKRIGEVFIEKEDDYGKIKSATDELYELFLEICGFSENDENLRKHCYLPTGKAIGTVWAGLCVKEMVRTKKFIRGIYQGIKCAQKIFPDTCLHILYAGTGPFAALMVPVTSFFTSNEIKFTLLEINKDSIENLEKVIRKLDISDYVEEIVKCDASKYEVPQSRHIHMIITETMQRALKNEPQVSITLNLARQMEKGGILIPEKINIKAVLLDTKRDVERIMGVKEAESDYCYPLKSIFELDKNTESIKVDGNEVFPEVKIEISDNIEKRYETLCLFTDIQVFNENCLTYMQSSLNLPEKIKKIDWQNNAPKMVSFQYVINEKPGFTCRFE